MLFESEINITLVLQVFFFFLPFHFPVLSLSVSVLNFLAFSIEIVLITPILPSLHENHFIAFPWARCRFSQDPSAWQTLFSYKAGDF